MVTNAFRDRVERAKRYGRCQERAAAVADDAALRGEHEVTADLIRRALEELTAAERLPVTDAQREEERRAGEESEDGAETPWGDGFGHFPLSSFARGCSLPSSTRLISASR